MILQKEIFIYGYIPLYSEEIIFQEKNQDFRKNEVRSHGQCRKYKLGGCIR